MLLGGMVVNPSQLNNRVAFTKGSSYEANLSDLMNATNPNAESSYSVMDPIIQPHSLLEFKQSAQVYGIRI